MKQKIISSNQTENETGLFGIQKRHLKLLIIPLAIFLILAVWYLSETDQDRLARAYEYSNPLLCNFIFNSEERVKCNAVLNGDINACNSLNDEYRLYLCYYGVILKTEDLKILEEPYLETRCYDRELSSLNKRYPDSLEKNKLQAYKHCNFTLGLLKDVYYKYLARKTSNLDLCYNIKDSQRKDFCIMELTKNSSYCLPEAEYPKEHDACIAVLNKNVSLCRGLDNSCYYRFAYAFFDSHYCKMITDRNTRNDCFIAVYELPAELQKMGAKNES